MHSQPNAQEIHEFVRSLLEGSASSSVRVLDALICIQEHFRYIPVEAAYELSCAGVASFAQIVSIISVFDGLSIEPVGEHLVLVCDGTACHTRGSLDLVKALEDELGVSCGHTSPDGRFTLKTVFCIGACSLAPIVLVDGKTFGKIALKDIKSLALSIEKDELQGQ